MIKKAITPQLQPLRVSYTGKAIAEAEEYSVTPSIQPYNKREVSMLVLNYCCLNRRSTERPSAAFKDSDRHLKKKMCVLSGVALTSIFSWRTSHKICFLSRSATTYKRYALMETVLFSSITDAFYLHLYNTASTSFY